MSLSQQRQARDVLMSDGDADELHERRDGGAEAEEDREAADGMLTSEDEDDEDDEVVASFPISLHQELTPHLYLIGSPFRPASRPYDSDLGPLQSVRVKPQQRRVELEYGLQQDEDDLSGHYDRHSPHRLQRLLLAGRPVPCKTNYAIAAFSPHSGLHLTPLSATVRVKPDLQYLDVEAAEEALVQEAARREEEELERERERERQRDSEEWTAEDEAEDRRRRAAAQREEEEAKAAPDLRQLTVRFKRKESEKSAAYRQASHAFIKQQEDKEQWMQLQHRDAASEQAEAERQRLIVSSSSTAASSSLPAAETMDTMSYLSYLNPHSAAAHLSSASYPERILALLRSARLLPFTRILSKLGIPAASSSPTAVSLRAETLHSCDRFGYYIQHAFVLKSSLVFDSHITAASMDPALAQQVKAEQRDGGGSGNRERERRGAGGGGVVTREEVCRDYLLCQFYQSPVVHRDRVCSVMRLDVEAMEERLQELSERREGAAKGGWQWKWRQDDSEDRCLNSLPAFAAMMRQQHKQIKEMETRARWALETQQSAAAAAAAGGQQPLSLSAGSTASSSSSSLIINNNQPAPSLPSSSSSPAPSSAQNAALTLLTGLFRQYGVCSEAFLLGQFAAAASPVSAAPASASLPPSPLSSLSSDTFRSVIHSTSLAITPSLFIRKSLQNPHVDRYRAVIASLFAVRSAVRKGDVHRAIEDCYGDEIPDNLYRKVMKEFATFDKGIWTLKTGNY